MNIKRFLLRVVAVITAWTLLPTMWIVSSVVALVAFLAAILLELVFGTAAVAKNTTIDAWNALKELKGDAKRPAKITFYLMTAQFSKLQALSDEEKK